MGNKIGIFGGSFDPPTKAHLQIGEDLILKGYLDAVWYLPCYQSLHGKKLTDADIRIDMLWHFIGESKLCTDDMSPDDLKHQGLWVCPYEIENKMAGRTIDVIEKMFKYYKENGHADDEFYMIIGMDNAENIHRFVEWEKVISAPFIVLNRDGCESTQTWFKEDPHVFADDICVPNISSTMIRNAIRVMKVQGLKPEFFDWCLTSILADIIDWRLYNTY